MRLKSALLFVVVAASLGGAPAGAAGEGQATALERVAANAGGHIDVSVSPATGAYDMVRAKGRAVLLALDYGSPETRATTFLRRYGALVGATDARALKLRSVERDRTTGMTHVKFDQSYRGIPVFGAQVAVHLNARGVNAVNGVFVPSVKLGAPSIDAARAEQIALRATRALHPNLDLSVESSSAQIYRDGLIEQRPGRTVLAFAVQVTGEHVAEQVWVDASSGRVFNSISQHEDAVDRCVYTPAYVNPTGADELAVRKEGQPATNVPPIDNLYDFSGQVYDFFGETFGRDSWDGAGHKMRTVYDFTAVCPNAYWDGTQKIARFCPGFDIDDVVAHEWGHAYTQATHGLIYQDQPGALNESYSDIWGEVIDLTNGVDGIGGSNNAEPAPNGQRWIVGEELGAAGAAIGLRDMWDPESRNFPSKVSSTRYVCGTVDGGGVHSNSSVPNHAFAMLVDGKTFNGHTIGSIGMTKASHIYYQAMVAYQTPTSGFLQHAQALRAACADLLGVDLNPISTDPAGQAITSNDCEQVDEAIAATEMLSPPTQCGGPLLNPNAPLPCPGGATLFTEDWESGIDGWTLESVGRTEATWPDYNFVLDDTLPQDRAGTGVWAANSNVNGCAAGAPLDPAGRFSLTSPSVVATDGVVTLRFDHSVSSPLAADGGNVLINVNDAGFDPLPDAAYSFNGPNSSLGTANGNPKPSQRAWSGADTGLLTGSWGTSIANLSIAGVTAGDSFQLRFEFGQDCLRGFDGWFIDDVSVMTCPLHAPPELTLGEGYSQPDPDGSYDLTWQRPEGASGPDLVQEAVVGEPFFGDDAEYGLFQWNRSTEGAGAFDWQTSREKPLHLSTAFHARGNEATTGTSSLLTLADPIAIPAVGQTSLTFKDWSYNHAGDKSVVEVSADGANWTQVYLRSTPYVTAGEADFVLGELEERTVDLSAFAGQEVLLRLRFTQGPEIYVDVTRFGWYVDDIVVRNITWSDLTTTVATTFDVTGRASGEYRYRVRTAFGAYESGFSNVVTALVE